MRITPKSDEELAVMNLIPEGAYQFEVVAAEDTQSKSGNDMIKLDLTVWDAEGRPHLIYDYLLEAMAKKLKHFAKHTGLIAKYELGAINANDCLGKCGTLQLVIQEDKTGKYQPRNSVADYIEKQVMIQSKNEAKENEIFNDDIPF